MPYNDRLTLLAVSDTAVDAYGDRVVTESRKTVFCQRASIGMKEFYQAESVGFKPEIKFKLSDNLDYDGQEYAEYNGTKYHIIRTYTSGNELELVCAKDNNTGV